MDWDNVHDAYPVNRELIWLNNCGTVPPGEHVLRAMTRYLNAYAARGVFSPEVPYNATLERIKTILCGLLNCSPEELTLVHHTAEGMLFISHGLDLQPEDEILLLENEYPSNVYPWKHWEARGVKIGAVPVCDHPDRFLEALKEQFTDRTRVITLSAVHWCTGMPLPLESVGALCQENDIIFVVDGAQGVGHQPLDLKKAGVDFMAFSAWKWLMGPLGLGGFYVAKEKLESLNPVFWATGSVVDDETYFPYREKLKPDADRFILSTPNFGDWIYFQSALEFLQTIGFDSVRKRIWELNAYLAGGLRQKGFTVLADHFPDYPTGITLCTKPGLDAPGLVKQLRNQGVIAADRLGYLRLAPHIYNSFDQLKKVVEIIGRV